MDSSAHILKHLRMAPTIQQGGTQTIQQSIYITHDNPCGINKLIFQKMGFTGIRYIDLKNYLDAILASEEMKLLFEQVRTDGTDFIYHPLDVQKQNKYLYSTSQWAEAGISNLPVSPTFYTGYEFSFSVYDGSGSLIYSSNTPSLKIITDNGGTYTRNTVSLISTAQFNTNGPTTLQLYKMCNNYILLPYLNVANAQSLATKNSDFVINQLALPETIMAIASLLVDSANTRTFGVPKYGFSNRSDQLQKGGIAYYCTQFINIFTVPDKDGNTTLIESIFARLALVETGSPLTIINMQESNVIQEEEDIMEQSNIIQEDEDIMEQPNIIQQEDHIESKIFFPQQRPLPFHILMLQKEEKTKKSAKQKMLDLMEERNQGKKKFFK